MSSSVRLHRSAIRTKVASLLMGMLVSTNNSHLYTDYYLLIGRVLVSCFGAYYSRVYDAKFDVL